jgi:hypothetical protein
MDVGAGPGRPFNGRVRGGVVGLVMDGRGRPLVLPEDEAVRKRKIVEWNKAMDLYPSY